MSLVVLSILSSLVAASVVARSLLELLLWTLPRDRELRSAESALASRFVRKDRSATKART